MTEADSNTERPERTRERLASRYQAVLTHPLTPQNIAEYAQEAFVKLQRLKEDAIRAYAKFSGDSTHAPDAYRWAGIGNVDDALKNAHYMIERTRDNTHVLIDTLQSLSDAHDVPEQRLQFDRVVLPYLITLSHILERDFDITVGELSIGYSSKPQQTLSCTIPELNRMVIYSIDAEHLHSHIIDIHALAVLGLTTHDLLSMPAGERDEYIRTSPTIGEIIETKTHTVNLRKAFHHDFVDRMPERFEKAVHRASIQELDAQRAPYTQFSEEVAYAWLRVRPQPTSVQDWYHSLGNTRPPHWPSNPQKYYSPRGKGREGWISWPALVGTDMPEPLSYKELQNAVTAAWSLAGKPKNIQEWYFSIAPSKRNDGWPGNPENFYKSQYRNKVWQSWRHLVGEQQRAPQLPYADFVHAVRERWTTDGKPYPIDRWYRSLAPRPRGWDSNPQQVYKKNHPRYKSELNGDWQGWSHLVGVPDGRIQQ